MASAALDASEEARARIEALEDSGRDPGRLVGAAIAVLAFSWAVFQLWIASPLPSALWLVDVQKRGIHLGFALALAFLIYPATKRHRQQGAPVYDLAFALTAALAALYLFFAYRNLVLRQGILLDIDLLGVTIPFEALLGAAGIALLLEATRRSIGLPLVIVASVFLVYSVFGQSIDIVIAYVGAVLLAITFSIRRRPRVAGLLGVVALGIIAYALFGETLHEILSHKGVSLRRLIGYQWLGGEAIFGIPIDVSTSFVFLFVLFGTLLERAGAGHYFLDLAFAMVGRYRGGPAKAAILASGMTGAISGSSIANVVTTGTFTIPVMVKTGMPPVKAGAIEVAASTNGQIMPPIMGAAAFIIAEFIGISYFDVVVHALIPALISYCALFYLSHLEALKLKLTGLPRSDLPQFWRTFTGGIHYTIPIIVLIYLLMVERWSASSAVFYAIIWTILVILTMCLCPARYGRSGLVAAVSIPVVVSGVLNWIVGMAPINASVWGIATGFALLVLLAALSAQSGEGPFAKLVKALNVVRLGMIGGARSMVTVGIAVAAAGIIVGAVSSTGLNNAMVGVVEAIAGNNVYILLGLTAVLCLLLGMGLPTTANYLVVASLLAGVLVELGAAAGLELPLIAVHLFVFYFGLMADSTPPVCLAAFAASGISRADPMKTGVQSFLYDIRTAILPFIFLFNTELLLIGVTNWLHGILVFCVSLLALLCFCSVTQNWLLIRLRWYESILLVVAMVGFFRPDLAIERFWPEYRSVGLEAFAEGSATTPADRKTRIHIVRETDYGERLKLFVVQPQEDTEARQGAGDFGLVLAPGERPDAYEVTNVAFDSQAEAAGVTWGDYVTGIDVAETGRPAREWVYPFAMLFVAVTVMSQLYRRRRLPESAAPA